MDEADDDDPWTRKRTVTTIAIIDIVSYHYSLFKKMSVQILIVDVYKLLQLLAFFLIGYAGVRLLSNDFTDQTIVYVLYSEESEFFRYSYMHLRCNKTRTVF